MYIIQRETQKKIPCEIIEISKEELSEILSQGIFLFDWMQVIHYRIYALIIKENKKVVGLMALKDVPDELRIEIILLELSKDNIGKSKAFERIAGLLIAWACYISYLKGYYGFVSLVPKTRLIPYYINAYGFQQFGRQLASDLENSQRLIKQYLDDEL
jgi:hypothetical protein